MVAGHLQVKKNYYYMVLNLKDENGMRKIKWLPTGIPVGRKQDLKRAEALLMETRLSYKETAIHGIEAAGVCMTGDMLFSDYMIAWLRIIRSSIEQDTYAGYEWAIKKRIAPYFCKAGISLAELSALDIEQYYEYCLNTLKMKGTTVQHFHANIHKALKFAVRHGLRDANPMDKVERPKGQSFVGAFYSVAELKMLFEVVKGDPIEFPVLVAAFYGLRRSEIIGLRWQAIDFESNTISIDHTVVQCRLEGKLQTIAKDRTKNKSSCRSMPLEPQFREMLLKMKAHQEENRRLCGNCYVENDYVYVNDLGVPYSPDYVTHHFKLVLRKNGLREIRFHDLRHSCASLLLKSGATMKDIQDWLGHSSYATTANIYTHLDSTTKSSSAAKMTQALRIGQ